MLPPDLVSTLSDCAKHDFAGARQIWFSRQFWFGAAVIVGLILEFFELRYDLLSIIRSRIRRYRYRIIVLESRVELAKVAAFIGWVFIVGGLLGELRAGSRIEDLSARIQECSDAKVAKATLEAGDAATSAKTAHQELGAVKAETDDLLAKYRAAEKDVDELRKANIEAAKTLEAEKVKRLELAKGLMPRKIYDTSGLLAKLAGQFRPNMVMFEYTSEHESLTLATQLNGLFNTLGWPAFHRLPKWSCAKDGITISVGSLYPNRLPDQLELNMRLRTAEVLRSALQDAGLDAQVSAWDASDLPPEVLLVEIGPNPNHALEQTLAELGGPPKPTAIDIGTNRGITLSQICVEIPEWVPPPIQSAPQK